jgi:SAM-dependent methyltransferase
MLMMRLYQPQQRRQQCLRGILIGISLIITVAVVTTIISGQENVLRSDLLLSLSHDATKSSSSSSSSSIMSHDRWDPQVFPLAVPPGEGHRLPSIRVNDHHVEQSRSKHKNVKYGGAGDKPHLGGFTQYDGHGVSPYVWSNMMEQYGVHSVVDVGCGRGTSTTWFLYQGVDVICVEGSHDAVLQSLLPNPDTQIVEHDFSRGPYWPLKTYDAAWSVEFLEHISRQFHFNYITVFRKAALIFVTSSRWGGWHHVEIHNDDWWIQKYESYGLRYSKTLTDQVRQWAAEEKKNRTNMDALGNPFYAQHILMSMKVFINPAVASLPQHAHLFPHDGCFKKFPPIETRPCRADLMETELPDSFKPIPFKQDRHNAWIQMVQDRLNITTQAK